MLPADLKAEQFSRYPSQARVLATAHLAVLRELPLSFVPSLLRGVLEYAEQFPIEQAALAQELDVLDRLSPAERDRWFQGFRELRLSPALEQFDWVNQPAQFLEQLSAYLWSSHQLDRYRDAATVYGNGLQAAAAPKAPVMPRLGIAVIGQGVSSEEAALFRRLRPHGTYFTNVDAAGGLEQLLGVAANRAEKHSTPYAHWYVDGGAKMEHSPLLTTVCYQDLAPVRTALLKNIDTEVSKPGMGPEQLHAHLARLAPADLGMHGDAVLDKFQVRVLTEGSGTQIFSTTFAQWTTREALRRAQAVTLLVRFAPRQRQRPMNELLSSDQANVELDPGGSLMDADMGAYYQWINQQRLPGAERSSFVAWFEGHSQAVAIGPSLPRGVESHSRVVPGALVSLAAG